MTATRQTLTRTTLALCAAILLASPTRPLLAAEVTFQFKTTIDASPLSGPVDAPLVVTYTFDSDSEPVFNNPPSADYVPIRMTLQFGDQCVTASGPGTSILVGNNWGDGTEDGYDVRIENYSGVVSGQLFGFDVAFFRFLLVDSDGTMLTSSGLPLSPDFALQADFQQTELILFNPETGEFAGLFIGEFPNTPPELKTPFSLTLIDNPITLVTDLRDGAVLLGLQNGLIAKLDDALQALTDGNENNDHVAVNKLQDFIDQVSAQGGKRVSAVDAVLLIDEAGYVIDILLLLSGC